MSYTLLDNNIGYLSISQFEEVTTKQFKAAVEDLPYVWVPIIVPLP